jgi:hypothetical protein
VLPAGDEDRLEPPGGAHRERDRRELDGFRTGTGDQVNFGKSCHDVQCLTLE